MSLKHTLLAAAVMVLAAVCLKFLDDSNDRPLKKSLSEFPMQIGDSKGTTSRFDEKVYEMLGVDDALLANFYDSKGGYIELYVGFYKSQREGKIIHSPKNCMPGSGWNIVVSSLLPLNIKNKNGNAVKVNRLILQQGAQRMVALYWFHSRGRVINSEYDQKIYLVWDAITRHRTDGSFIRLMSPVKELDESQTSQYLQRFAEEVFPILNDFIPT